MKKRQNVTGKRIVMTQLTTSWMWPIENGVNALRIDVDRKMMNWYDEIGCACSDDDLSITQTIAEFQTGGAPNNIQLIPEDVLGEIAQTLERLGSY